jgi:hypothetical protein
LYQAKQVAHKEAIVDDDIVSVRAAMQYIATSYRPDIAAPCQLLALRVGRGAYRSTYKAVKKLVQICHDTANQGLEFVRLDLETVRIVVLCDASFANADAYRSQLGFAFLMVDGNNNANLEHYASQRCTRVTRSVMAAALHELIVGLITRC